MYFQRKFIYRIISLSEQFEIKIKIVRQRRYENKDIKGITRDDEISTFSENNKCGHHENNNDTVHTANFSAFYIKTKLFFFFFSFITYNNIQKKNKQSNDLK